MPSRIVHRLPAECHALSAGTFAACRKRPVIAFAIVQIVIHVAVEMFASVIPGSRTDEYPAGKPFRPVVAIRRAIVGRCFVISVGTNRRTGADANPDRDVRMPAPNHEQSQANNGK